MQTGSLFMAVYMCMLPFLVVVHMAEHHHAHSHAGKHHTALYESAPDCNICYFSKHQKVFFQARELNGLANVYVSFLAVSPAMIIPVSNNHFQLRAPPTS